MNIKNAFTQLKNIHSMWSDTSPRLVTINLTSRCNQRCIYCEVGRDTCLPDFHEIGLNDLFWIIDQMADYKIPKLALFGGEPFLYKEIFKIIMHASSHNIKTFLSTNGMQVGKLSDDEISVLTNCHTHIAISLDSFEDSILSKVRGTPQALSNALRAIDVLKRAYVPLQIGVVVSRFNYHELYSTVINANRLGIKKLTFQPVVFNSNYPDRSPLNNKVKLNVDSDQLPVLIEQLNNVVTFEKKHDIVTNAALLLQWIQHYIISTEHLRSNHWFFQEVLNDFYCWDLNSIITINYDGTILACELSPVKISIYENKHLGLVPLWKMANYAVKTEMRNMQFHPYCRSCCNHFNRNMVASVIKHPFKNRTALKALLPVFGSRILKNLNFTRPALKVKLPPPEAVA